MKMAVRLDEGSGRAIVLLHGFPGNATDWEQAAGQIGGGYRVIVPDLLGFGDSPRPTAFEELWVEPQARALAATLDDLGADRVALVGHDMGGGIAVTFYRLFPERMSHLALISTNMFPDTPVDFPLSLTKAPVIGRGVKALLFSGPSLRLLGRLASRTRGVRAAPNDAGEVRAIRTMFGRVLDDLADLYTEIEATLGTIDVPAVVMWGDRDLFFRPEQGRRTADAIPGAELVALPGCGHLVPKERPEDVAAMLRKLLGEH